MRTVRSRSLLLALSILTSLLVLAGCATRPQPVAEKQASPQIYMPPALTEAGVHIVPDHEVLRYVKSLDPANQGLNRWQDMQFALTQSLRHTAAFPPEKIALNLGERSITYGHMKRTLQRLNELLPMLDKKPELLASEFVWLRVGPDFRFTGYYEPTLEASPVRTEQFTQPLYTKPDDFKKIINRKGRYHSRKDIESRGLLRNRGLEIAWIEDPVDLVILQIQGSGRLAFPDGSIRYALYNGQNKHPHVPLGRVMKQRGLLPPDVMNLQAIRDYLTAHPSEVRELLNTDPSYVFFRLHHEGSYGSMGRILSPQVSVAVDQKILPNGLATFMSLYTPDDKGFPTRPFQGLMLPQDSGGAIKQHRVDLFYGNGAAAEFRASYLNQHGAVMVLLERSALASL